MALRVLAQMRTALAHLNPSEVIEDATRRLTIRLHAADEASYVKLERFFTAIGGNPTETLVLRANRDLGGGTADLDVALAGTAAPAGTCYLDPAAPSQFVTDVMKGKPDLGLALARRFAPFRQPYTNQVVMNVARENALFSLATAVPNVVPLLSLPLSVGEFASDTAFLTMNQIRMAFLLAAAHGRKVGYSQQKSEIASVVASAFGWRAIARELVGKIPFGGGLIPKAGVSFAATYMVGRGLEKYYSTGIHFTQREQKEMYEKAVETGQTVAKEALDQAK